MYLPIQLKALCGQFAQKKVLDIEVDLEVSATFWTKRSKFSIQLRVVARHLLLQRQHLISGQLIKVLNTAPHDDLLGLIGVANHGAGTGLLIAAIWQSKSDV